MQLLFIAGVAIDAGARHHLGVVLAVPGDGHEGDHREPDRERLHAGESAGVLDQCVGRRHQGRHLVGPADDRAVAAGLELGAERVVSPADGDRMELSTAPDCFDGRDDVADPPGAGDDEYGAIVVEQPEVAPHRIAVVLRIAESLAHERSAGTGVLPAAGLRGLGRDLAHGQVTVDRRGAPTASGRRSR